MVPVAGACGQVCCQGIRASDAGELKQIFSASSLEQELVV